MRDQAAITDLSQRISVYVLPGRVTDPLRCLDEAIDAESVGIGGVWISERYSLKEPAVIAGMLAQAVPTLRIGSTFYPHMRHPIVTASVANFMQAVSGDRFTLVLARASPDFFQGYDVRYPTFTYLKDTMDVCRRLWRGEKIDYDGILGKFEQLRLTDYYDGPPPPIVFTATGPKALAFAGENCDGVLLHPLLTTEAVARSSTIIRNAAQKAGRDPASVRVIANVIVAPDLPSDEEDAVVGGRAVTYLQSEHLGPVIVQANGWDPKILEQLRAHPTIAQFSKTNASQHMTRGQLVEASRTLPREWLMQGNAVGTAVECARRLGEYLDAGADEILLHGSAPKTLAGVTKALQPVLAARAPAAV